MMTFWLSDLEFAAACCADGRKVALVYSGNMLCVLKCGAVIGILFPFVVCGNTISWWMVQGTAV